MTRAKEKAQAGGNKISTTPTQIVRRRCPSARRVTVSASHHHGHTIRTKARLRARGRGVRFCESFKVTRLIQ